MKAIEFDLIECDNGKWQWECCPMAGVMCYSNPATLEQTKLRAVRFAANMNREADMENTDPDEAKQHTPDKGGN